MKLADNKVVYSAGVGSVVFVPVIGGKKQHPGKFRNVLHVPDLRNNLISVLYLCRSKGFLVSIDAMQMAFRHHPRPVLFVANIGTSNCTFLDGETALHTDVHDVGHLSLSGFQYCITFMDDYLRFRFVMPLKAKSQAFEAFKTFKAFAENQSE